MSVIRAQHYTDTENALKADPIIKDMAGGVSHLPMDKLIHSDGTARHNFMMGALDEYKARGGKIPTHIGGPANAILSILKAGKGKS